MLLQVKVYIFLYIYIYIYIFIYIYINCREAILCIFQCHKEWWIEALHWFDSHSCILYYFVNGSWFQLFIIKKEWQECVYWLTDCLLYNLNIPRDAGWVTAASASHNRTHLNDENHVSAAAIIGALQLNSGVFLGGCININTIHSCLPRFLRTWPCCSCVLRDACIGCVPAPDVGVVCGDIFSVQPVVLYFQWCIFLYDHGLFIFFHLLFYQIVAIVAIKKALCYCQFIAIKYIHCIFLFSFQLYAFVFGDQLEGTNLEIGY